MVVLDNETRATRLHQRLAVEGIRTDPNRFGYKPATDHPLTRPYARPCQAASTLAATAIQLPIDIDADPDAVAGTVRTAWDTL